MEVAVEELVGVEVAMQEVLPCVEEEAGGVVDMKVSNNPMPEFRNSRGKAHLANKNCTMGTPHQYTQLVTSAPQ